MNHLKLAVTAALALFLIVGCGPDKPREEIALTVNSSNVTTQEFFKLLKEETSVDPEFDLNTDKIDAFMDYLIRKELLISEASRLQLDREEAFVRTIERYWESTLIRNLLARKTREMQDRVLVTDDDTLTFYTAAKDDFTEPYEQVRESIKRRIEEERVNDMIEAWIKELAASATIRKNPDILKKDRPNG